MALSCGSVDSTVTVETCRYGLLASRNGTSALLDFFSRFIALHARFIDTACSVAKEFVGSVFFVLLNLMRGMLLKQRLLLQMHECGMVYVDNGEMVG